MVDITHKGQVFTPEHIVSEMLSLKKNTGSVLEPSCGDGAFLKHLSKNAVGVELDASYIGENVLNIDFFDYSIENKFDTVIGNPPYVRFQDILEGTKKKLDMTLFDKRSNLYLFFIKKCIEHLKPNGELIFITPRDFLKATSSIKMNEFLYRNGTITDIIDLGDAKIFDDATPNCIIWRFEKDNFVYRTNEHKRFVLSNGQLLFINNEYPIQFRDLFFVKVGAVSGADYAFIDEEFGNVDFVFSETRKSGKTRKMIYNIYTTHLNQYKEQLLARKIKEFSEENWWQWGRALYMSKERRIYVNSKTRIKSPFFIHNSPYYDGSVLAIFPKKVNADIKSLCDKLNKVNWEELGFVCNGRFIFSQRSLENCRLPSNFRE